MDRVLEIGGFGARFCGRLFVQGKSEVVRIESVESMAGWVSEAAMEAYLDAGKRRLQTNKKDLIAALAKKADVVILDARDADTVERIGFDTWETPVKVAITPFGRTGPKRNWQATPNVLLAMGGYTKVMGDEDRAPLTLPGHYVEFQSGTFAYAAANACRLAEERNTIDISMLEVVMALSQFTTVMWHCAGEIRSRHGSDFWWVVPTNLFRCADGWIYVNVVPSFWDVFAISIDKPELLIDERFTTNALRCENRAELHEIISQSLAPMSKAEVQSRATKYRVPIGVVQTFGDILRDPHLAVRDVWQRVKIDSSNVLHSPRRPWRVNGDPPDGITLEPKELQDG